ncbi:restriction endonuclease subunit S [uncultured Ruminococcus sp.]|uniref:restriction endonuclease subunit S n=1 Tax=uncultured Ruminococcus sp. TaxID=165186 RepID=UPI002664F9C7|nr:restriction endonuclease subunit S [uncultured Ruminococcus sp.]
MEHKKLGDIATYVNGYAFKPEDRGTKGLPIIRIQDLTGNSYDLGFYNGEYPKKIELNNGDILISWSASLGVYEWNRGKALLNQHIFKAVFDKLDVNKKYFVFAVKYNLKEMEKRTHGATMKHITKKDFDNVLVPFPPLNKQQEIAATLDKLQSIITHRRTQLEKLDLLVKARFVEMFGEPILNEKGWNMVTIGDIVTEVKYGTSKPAVEGGKYPYLRMNNLTYDGHLDLTNLKMIDIPDSEIEKCIVHRGDVLFNRTNSIELVGKTCVFDKDEDMVIAGYIIRVRLKSIMLPIVLSYFMNTDALKKKLRNMAKGAVNQANINAQEFKSINIYLPPIELQTQFADFVKQVDKSRVAIQNDLEQAQMLFDSLMQEYFG